MKKGLLILLGVLTIGTIGYFASNFFLTIKPLENNTDINFKLKTLEGEIFTHESLSKSKIKLFIYFNSECEHCQFEAEQISSKLQNFDDIQVVFVSYETVDKIKVFANNYNLFKLKDVVFLEDERLILVDKYKIKQFPFLILYAQDNSFIRKYEGPVDLSIVIDLINSHNEQN